MSKLEDSDVVAPSSWAIKLGEMRHSGSEVAESTQRENSLTELAELKGWTIIKGYVKERIRELRDNFRTGIKEDSYELIGQKAIVIDIVEEELEGLVSMVENTRQVIKEREAEKIDNEKKESKTR